MIVSGRYILNEAERKDKMTPEITRVNAEQEELLKQLAKSRAQVLLLAQTGKLDLTGLRQLTDTEATLTTQLYPWPLDPSEHVLAAHAFVHPYLERLPLHDPARIVVADEEHSYTPRKILRRVLDHALDHLNQIEQWLAWQQQGIVPTPTDGWATSAETFQEDLQPLAPEELRAWLWRIDLAVGLVASRAKLFSAAQLDWQPPDDGWTLRRTLHHLALAEVFYAICLDEALPDETIVRYSEANRRFEQQLRWVLALTEEENLAIFSLEGSETTTAEQVAQRVLVEESRLLYT